MANINNTVATVNNNANKPAFSQFMQSNLAKTMMNNVLGNSANLNKFATSIITAVANNQNLKDCSHMSILSGAMQAEALKLSCSPQLGQCYLVPFDNKTGKAAQFIVGYRGLIQLAIRSNYYKNLNVIAVKKGELVRFDPLSEEIEINLIEDEAVREKAETVGYYAFLEYKNGFRKAIYWSKAKMENHALTYSKGYKAKKGYTFWEKDFDVMAFKTMLRHLISRWGAMSIDMQTAIEVDNATINYSDNHGLTAEYTEENDIIDASITAEEVEQGAVKIVNDEKKQTMNDDEQVASFFKK